MKDILIKYFSARMLRTLDLDQLFLALFDEFGECQITFVPMSPQETSEASSEVAGLTAVNARIWMFLRTDNGLIRLPDLESEIVRAGQK